MPYTADKGRAHHNALRTFLFGLICRFSRCPLTPPTSDKWIHAEDSIVRVFTCPRLNLSECWHVRSHKTNIIFEVANTRGHVCDEKWRPIEILSYMGQRQPRENVLPTFHDILPSGIVHSYYEMSFTFVTLSTLSGRNFTSRRQMNAISTHDLIAYWFAYIQIINFYNSFFYVLPLSSKCQQYFFYMRTAKQNMH